ncbi:MAG: diaminopimelate epimerase [Kiritimatiellae bacterium]|jgi:diaminopimelate epimerase|nr:diaminopimelate epimerase [Kiritimatiellia bacterium]NLD90477.1 diaminopimelate epimerase [Lentisphaerota bacterium]HPC20527.1 diaminopimelate epimerase [Kiritimatiellia bacterium]HQN80604.1 diaminopimelate epimerase [Kiritimatiellia bacterium]HQQ61578.1 diaminopimelate epimerase [Kiritimatiellia bacterium]
MSIPFWKMHGAGNDFILVDDRALTFPAHDTAFIARLCDRRRGIGAEGLLLIQPSSSADFRMRFFNPDGGEADMCGNGARCIARLAHEIGAAPAGMRIETPAGVVRAEVLPPLVRLHLPPPKDWRMNLSIAWQGSNLTVHSVNTGVPHAICVVDDLAGVDVAPLGALIRRHALFAPAGTNADFIQLAGPDALAIRTYERGVEAETLACGTGIAAAALIAERLGLVRGPVQVQTAGGDTLEVALSPLTLTGPAEHSFRGTVDYR